jgi:hypothetical protein
LYDRLGDELDKRINVFLPAPYQLTTEIGIKKGNVELSELQNKAYRHFHKLGTGTV